MIRPYGEGPFPTDELSSEGLDGWVTLNPGPKSRNPWGDRDTIAPAPLQPTTSRTVLIAPPETKGEPSSSDVDKGKETAHTGPKKEVSEPDAKPSVAPPRILAPRPRSSLIDFWGQASGRWNCVGNDASSHKGEKG